MYVLKGEDVARDITLQIIIFLLNNMVMIKYKLLINALLHNTMPSYTM